MNHWHLPAVLLIRGWREVQGCSGQAQPDSAIKQLRSCSPNHQSRAAATETETALGLSRSQRVSSPRTFSSRPYVNRMPFITFQKHQLSLLVIIGLSVIQDGCGSTQDRLYINKGIFQRTLPCESDFRTHWERKSIGCDAEEYTADAWCMVLRYICGWMAM